MELEFSSRKKQLLVVSVLVVYFVLSCIWHFNSLYPWDDDCVGRYFNVRNAFAEPKHFIGVWNRPLFVLVFAIPFWFSYHSILLMPLLMCWAAWLLFISLESQKVKFAPMVVVFLLFQTFFFPISRDVLTEPLTALLLSIAYFCFVRKNWILFTIAGSLLPLARLELSIILIFWIYILLVNKQWKYIFLLLVPVVIWNLCGALMSGDIIWLVKQTIGKEEKENIYGHTEFSHYFKRYIYLTGPVIFYFIGLALFERIRNRKFDIFPFSVGVTGFLIYVIFSWKLNLGQAAGFMRNLIPLSAISAILALEGFNSWISVLLGTETAQGNTSTAKTDKRKGKSGTEQHTPIGMRAGNFKMAMMYSLVMLVLCYFFMSALLENHHSLSDTEKDYSNLYIILSLTAMLVIFNLINRKDSARLKRLFAVISVTLVAAGCITYTLAKEPPNVSKSPERESFIKLNTMMETSGLMKRKALVNHIWFFWVPKLDRDTNQYKLVTLNNILKAEDSSLVLWENHYSNRLAGNVPLEKMTGDRQFLELFRILSSDKRFIMVVFQKVGDRKIQERMKILDDLILKIPCKELYMTRANLNIIEMKNYSAALADYDKVIKTDTSSFEPYFNRGLAHFNLNAYDKAGKDFLRTIQLQPQNHEAYYNMGLCEFNQKKIAEAIYYYSKCLEINPSFTSALMARANAYTMTNQINMAMEDYTSAIATNLNLGEAYLLRGILRFNSNQKTGACEDFNKANSLGKAEALGYLNQYCK